MTTKPVSLYHRPCNRKKLAKEEEKRKEEGQIDLRVVEGKSIADHPLAGEGEGGLYLFETGTKKREGQRRKTPQWPGMILFVESSCARVSLKRKSDI